MSKQRKDKHWLLDRPIPKWSTKIGNTKVEFTLGGRIPDGWTVRDVLKFLGLVWAILLAVGAADAIFGIF